MVVRKITVNLPHNELKSICERIGIKHYGSKKVVIRRIKAKIEGELFNDVESRV